MPEKRFGPEQVVTPWQIEVSINLKSDTNCFAKKAIRQRGADHQLPILAAPELGKGLPMTLRLFVQ
jgi:hypothetical protein